MSKRPATISPSQLDRLMPKSGLGQGAETYADELLMKMLGVEEDEYVSYDMQRGNEQEPKAIIAYEQRTFTEVTVSKNSDVQKERFYHPKYDFVSGEPDGLIGDSGLIEIKSPKAKWHLRNYIEDAQLSNYYNQMQGYIWILEREWCDFVSWHPGFPEGMKLSIKRVERDQETIDLIEKRCREFWDKLMIPRMKEFDLYSE